MSKATPNKTLELILKSIAAGGELSALAISAYREIKALSGKSDDELLAVWVSTAEANEVEIAKRRLEIAGSSGSIDFGREITAEMTDE